MLVSSRPVSSPCRSPLVVAAVLLLAATSPAAAQQVAVEEFTLPNGMQFLLVPRSDQPNVVSAGWVARVGSVNERPGITGISHFFEHMMFKGTDTIGTRDPKKDSHYRAEQKAIRDEINQLVWTKQYDRFFKGEIDDPWNPANDTQELRVLRGKLDALIRAQQGRGEAGQEAATIVKDEFDQVYTKAGGSGMNAFTTYDLTCYFITVPSNKLELWAWMESDRLHDSVFREFYSERDVVHEERRLRTESTPTCKFEEQFDAMFWASSGYSWPIIGWPSDLNSYTFEQALDYWNIYYRPGNLCGVLVGDFDPKRAKELITTYFSRLDPGTQPPPPGGHARSRAARRTADERGRRRSAGDRDPLPHGACRPRRQLPARHARRGAERADGAALYGPRRGARHRLFGPGHVRHPEIRGALRGLG